jgi:hypothetical protein
VTDFSLDPRCFWQAHDDAAWEAKQVADLTGDHRIASHDNYALRELVGMDRAAFMLGLTDRHTPGPRLDEVTT